MAKDQTFLLVEMEAGENQIQKLNIHLILRSYPSQQRALEDCELLEQANKMKTYTVLAVPHLDC